MIKKLSHFSILLIACCLFNNTLNAQWIQQNAPTSSKLEALFFLDENTGYTSSSFITQLFKTEDGGANWTSVGNYSSRDIWFSDDTNGYATSAAGSSSGTMKKSTNGGNTWSPITPPNSSAYLGVFTTTPTTAYFINTEQKVLKTTNAGASLSTITLPVNNSSANLTDIFFKDLNNGFITAQLGQLFRTTNAGTSWTDLSIDNFSTLNTVYFPSNEIGYVGGSNGKVLKSIDGGTTWIDKSLPNADVVQAIKFYDNNNGLAVCLSGKIYKTTNGADTWVLENSGTSSHIRNVFYLSETTAIAVGDDGTVLKNSNLLANDDFELKNEIQLHPNPVVDKSTLQLNLYNENTNLSIEIYDIKGQLIKKDQLTTNTYDVSKSDFNSGYYFLKVMNHNKTLKVIKFIIK